MSSLWKEFRYQVSEEMFKCKALTEYFLMGVSCWYDLVHVGLLDKNTTSAEDVPDARGLRLSWYDYLPFCGRHAWLPGRD